MSSVHFLRSTIAIQKRDTRKLLMLWFMVFFPITFILISNQANAAQTRSIGASPEAVSTDIAPSIHDILVSDHPEANGYVKFKKTTIPASSPKIYVTVQIKSAQSGSKVSVTFTTAIQKSAKASAVVTKSGNIMKAFVFENSDPIWAAGLYHVDVSLSSGATKSMTFFVK